MISKNTDISDICDMSVAHGMPIGISFSIFWSIHLGPAQKGYEIGARGQERQMEYMRISARSGRWSISGVAAVNCINQLVG